VIVVDKFAAGCKCPNGSADNIPVDGMGLMTILIGRRFRDALAIASAIWNGPMGVFEFDALRSDRSGPYPKQGATTIIGGATQWQLWKR